jgi:ionotropic glutamate receptor NMDA 1
MKLKLDTSAIIWPGNTDKQPPGFMIPTHLKVLTIEEKPFVYVREIQAEEVCAPEEIPCPHFNNTNAGTIRFLICIL